MARRRRAKSNIAVAGISHLHTLSGRNSQRESIFLSIGSPAACIAASVHNAHLTTAPFYCTSLFSCSRLQNKQKDWLCSEHGMLSVARPSITAKDGPLVPVRQGPLARLVSGPERVRQANGLQISGPINLNFWLVTAQSMYSFLPPTLSGLLACLV